ncbi:MAG: flagellin [Micavibrio sp.]|nr:flagellin [Micavibrio sp.]
MADVTLTAALRSNLLSLQGTQKLLDQTQLRLATGLKVNSALDNPNSYFAAQAVNNRATDLSSLLDGIGQSIQVLKAADQGLQTITSYLSQAQALAQNALDNANSNGGTNTNAVADAASYQAIQDQINALIGDAGYRGTNLLKGGTLQVTFNESGTSSLTVTGVDDTTTNTATLNLTPSPLDSATNIQTEITAIKKALDAARSQAATFGNNLNIIQTRQDFTQNLINVLQEGRDKLTVADKNEEGAKLLSLQTTQQLGITSLSLASQANQSVLKLFG